MNDPKDNKTYTPNGEPAQQENPWQGAFTGQQSGQPASSGQPDDPYGQYRDTQNGSAWQQSYQAPEYPNQTYQAPGYQSQPYQAPESQPSYQAYPVDGGQRQSNGLAIGSMICGILSLVLCCGMWISWILSLVALGLGIASLVKKAGGKGMAIAGIVTAVFGLVFSIGMLIFIILIESADGVMDYSFYNSFF